MKILKLATLLALMLPVFASAQTAQERLPDLGGCTVWYVDRDAPLMAPPGYAPAERGQSWQYAFREFYEALAAAEQGDVILVAGTEAVLLPDVAVLNSGDNSANGGGEQNMNEIFPNLSDFDGVTGVGSTLDANGEPDGGWTSIPTADIASADLNAAYATLLNNPEQAISWPGYQRADFKQIDRPFKPDMSGYYNRVPGLREFQLSEAPWSDVQINPNFRNNVNPRLATFYIGPGLNEIANNIIGDEGGPQNISNPSTSNLKDFDIQIILAIIESAKDKLTSAGKPLSVFPYGSEASAEPRNRSL